MHCLFHFVMQCYYALQFIFKKFLVYPQNAVLDIPSTVRDEMKAIVFLLHLHFKYCNSVCSEQINQIHNVHVCYKSFSLLFPCHPRIWHMQLWDFHKLSTIPCWCVWSQQSDLLKKEKLYIILEAYLPQIFCKN